MSLLWARRGESVRCADSRGTRGKGSGRRRSCTQGLLAPHLPFVTPPPPQEHRQDAPTSGLLAQCPGQGHLGPGLSLACPPCQPPRLHLRRAFHLESPTPTACACHPEPPNPRRPPGEACRTQWGIRKRRPKSQGVSPGCSVRCARRFHTRVLRGPHHVPRRRAVRLT